MAGVKGKSGGARPNTGGARPGAGRPRKPPLSLPNTRDPKKWLIALMQCPQATMSQRVAAARALLRVAV